MGLAPEHPLNLGEPWAPIQIPEMNIGALAAGELNDRDTQATPADEHGKLRR
jgi:hypothetical protein